MGTVGSLLVGDTKQTETESRRLGGRRRQKLPNAATLNAAAAAHMNSLPLHRQNCRKGGTVRQAMAGAREHQRHAAAASAAVRRATALSKEEVLRRKRVYMQRRRAELQAAERLASDPASSAAAATARLWRASEELQPGVQLENAAALRGGGNGVVVRGARNGSASMVRQVLHGYSSPSQWLSFSSTPCGALLWALFLHAKAGPKPPRPPHVRRPQHGDVCAAREGWSARFAPWLIEVALEGPGMVVCPIDTPAARRAAVGWGGAGAAKASDRADMLHEVLVHGAVRRAAVQRVFLVDFTTAYGLRISQHTFQKDYIGAVKPTNGFDKVRSDLALEFEREGAFLGDDGSLHLPQCLWNEFEANARLQGLTA